MRDKPLVWLGSARRDVRAFPAVYVLHAFEKRTRKTPPHELELARNRYRALINERRADDAKRK